MRNTLLNERDGQIKALVHSINRIRTCITILKEKARKSSLYDEIYLTDKELQTILKVSRRCLQEWRNRGLMPYYIIGGKVLYCQSEIQKLLDEHRFNVK